MTAARDPIWLALFPGLWPNTITVIGWVTPITFTLGESWNQALGALRLIQINCLKLSTL